MHIFLCVDDDGGMLFNRRRQSQDREVRRRILQKAAGHPLWMSPYSAKQFAETAPDTLCADDDFLSKAAAGDYCFVEETDIAPLLPAAETVTVYRWHRRYPSDVVCTVDWSSLTLLHSEDFAGSSHDCITEEVYGV